MADSPAVFGIIRIQTGDAGDEHPMLKPELTLGRGSDCDVVLLDDHQVSRRHVHVVYTAQGYQVQDLGSANGSLLNGQPLPARRYVPLGPGDVVQIGSFQVALRVPQPGAPVPPVVGEQVQFSARQVPGLIVYVGQQVQKFALDKAQITLGRQTDNDIVLAAPVVSSHHARLQQEGASYRIVDLGSANGLVSEGQRVAQKLLADGDVLTIANQVAVQYRRAVGFMPAGGGLETATEPAKMVALPTDQEPVRIGRAPDNQIVLDHPQISRYHAMIERMGVGRYRIHDLKSTNGIFVNNQRVDREAWLKEGDEIGIGPFHLALQEGVIRSSTARGLRLDALHLQKWVTKDKNLLQDISLSIYPQEFVALVGLSGAGKSTLMNALSGFSPATHGAVFINDVDLYRNFDMFRNELGYVPQKDIVHAELTVYQALDYVARLRMPPDTTPDERHSRILEVLDDLDLAERKDLPIHKLSGGQLKRVSIGVELLTKPRLFFLDEPTSGLDPGTEYNMMKLLRHLADQGRTVVLITHATKNVMLCDKVVFLVRGGYVAFYGPPEEALAYFDRYRTERERREKDMEFDSIYIVLEDEQRGRPVEWAERYRKSPEYQRYVVERLRARRQGADGVDATTAASRVSHATTRRISALRQLAILSARNLKILTRDRLSLALMLLLAPAIGLLDFMWGRKLFDSVEGDPGKIITMFFMLGLIAILVGALSSVLQIVKEEEIYKRERAVGLKIGPYILSKVWIGVILALYQSAVLLFFRQLFVNPTMPNAGSYVAMYLTLFLGTLSGYLFGLAISAGAPNINVALLLVIAVLVPQFMFAGALLPLDLIPGGETLSVVASTRWAFEAMVKITGFGDIVIEDPCWDNRPKNDEDGVVGWNTMLKLSDEEKQQAGCICMGSAMFQECASFPGIRGKDFYDAKAQLALSQPEPVKPLSPTPYPSPTPFPSPTPLATPNNPQGFSQYMDDMQQQGAAYQDARERQGSEYQDQREQQGDEYADAMTTYGDAKADWQRAREQAIQSAEGMMKAIVQNYGRTFKGAVTTRWFAMGTIMVVLFGLIYFFMKRKDVV